MEIIYWFVAIAVAVNVFHMGHKSPTGGNLIASLVMGALWPVLILLVLLKIISLLIFGRKKNGLDL